MGSKSRPNDAPRIEPDPSYFFGVMAAVPHPVWILTGDGGVVYHNALAQATASELCDDLSAPWCALWPKQNQIHLKRSMDSATKGQTSQVRVFISRADKNGVYWDIFFSPIYGSTGDFLHLLVVALDVTQDAESKAFLETVIQLLPLPLTVKRADNGRYVLVNRAFEAYCGFSSDEILGGAFLEKLSKEQVQIISAVDQQAIESQQTTTSEVVRVFESPSESRFYKVKRLATYDDSGPRHLITLREDITDQREAAIALNEALAAAQQASQAKSAFLANISHEIRTPLNGIVASADLLRKTALSDQGRELLDMIAASGLVLERLLADLLDFTTLQSSDVVIQAAAFNLHEWVGALVDKARPKAAAKGLDLHLRFTPPAQPWVLGDAVRTGQVLNRLIENALKFTDHGHISVSVAPSAEGRIRFEVADTGIGFDPKDYARIFDQFQQGDESATRRFGGSGLGLAISRPLVERMGGVLECHSQKGRGSTFWFELPLPSCTDPGALKSPEAPPKPLTSRLRVLIADDHPINRKILEMMLGDVADVCMVENGLEAVRAYGAQAHDLILMDIQMPVMDGLAAVREIRRLERERSVHTPIIMVSANALSEHVSAAIQAGADLHLAKPVTAARLFSAIDAVLSKRSAFSQAR